MTIPAALAILSSRLHVHYSIAGGQLDGTLEQRSTSMPKRSTFDPFPFPALLTDPAADPHAVALRERLSDLGARLEALRDDRLAADRRLTLTGLYNRLERRREALGGGAPLSEDEAADHARHHVPILAELHDAVDAAALGAYGWDDLAPALLGRPGATLPSALKDAEQEAAEDALLTRLVALNAERRAEEAAGRVRWLRPAFQAPRLGAKVPQGEQGAMVLDRALILPGAEAPTWPEAERIQYAAVRALLDAADAPLAPEDVARAFRGRLTAKRRGRVAEVLAVMADLGIARRAEGEARYATRR